MSPCLYFFLMRRVQLKNQNPFRWVEYSISASVMHVLIACLSGIMDMHLLFTLFALTATVRFPKCEMN